MKMTDRDGWRPISYAPIDGTKFYGGNDTTKNVYVTWYEKKTPNTHFDKMFGEIFFGEEGPVWWCEHPEGGITSFKPTHFLLISED